MNGLEAVLSGIAVQNDILKDHDGIVDDQTDGSGEAAQSHQVETLIGHFQHDEGSQQSDGYDQASYQRSSPIAEEQHENDGREQNADEYGIAHAGDGIVDDGGLVVKRLEMNAGRQRRGEFLNERVYFVGYIQGVAFGLAIDVEKNSGFTVGGHHGVDRGDRRPDCRDVSKTYGDAG